MLPIRQDMTKDQCRTGLRCLELDAYGNMVSVLRAQGSFTEDKKRLLSELAKVLSISNERHRAEIRRAVNDEKLSTIAEQLYGPNTWTDWAIEGRRTIPLLARSKAHTAFIELANSLSVVIATANAKKRASLQNNNTNKLFSSHRCNDYRDGNEDHGTVNDSNSKHSSCVDNVNNNLDDLVLNEKQNEVTNNIALLSEFKQCERKRKRSSTDGDNNLRKIKNRTIIVDSTNHTPVENNIDCITIDDSSSLLANYVKSMETSNSTLNFQNNKLTPSRKELLSIPVTFTVPSSSSSTQIENIRTISCQESSVLRQKEMIPMTSALDINLKTNLVNCKFMDVNNFSDKIKRSDELNNISKLENLDYHDTKSSEEDDCISKSFNYNSEIKIVQSNVKMKIVEADLKTKVVDSDLEAKIENPQLENKKSGLYLENKKTDSNVQTRDIEPNLDAKEIGTDLEIQIIESNKDPHITTINFTENTETKVIETNLEMEMVEPDLEIIHAEPALERTSTESKITESILETNYINEPTSITNISDSSLETNLFDSEFNSDDKRLELNVETKIIEDNPTMNVVEAKSESKVVKSTLKEKIIEPTSITKSVSPTVEIQTYNSSLATKIVSPILTKQIMSSILETKIPSPILEGKDVSTPVPETSTVLPIPEDEITLLAETTICSTAEVNSLEVPSSATILSTLNVKTAEQDLVRTIESNLEKKMIVSNSTTKLPEQTVKPKVEIKIVDPVLKSQILHSQLNTKIVNSDSGSTSCNAQSSLAKINRSSMAKVGITLNSDKTVSLSSLPDDKLGMKKKVIVVQKGLSKTVKLSQEVLDRVMGGKNLCITRKSGSFCLRPHRPITGKNGNQIPKMVTLPGDFVNSTLKSDHRVLFNIQKNKAVEIKTHKNINLHLEDINLHKKIGNINSDTENINFKMDNSNLVEMDDSYLPSESLQFHYENEDLNSEIISSPKIMMDESLDSKTVPLNLNQEGSIKDRNKDFLNLPLNIHGDIVVQDDTQIIGSEISDDICINEGEYLKDFEIPNCRKDVLLPSEQEIYNFELNADKICEIQTDETALTSEINMFPTQIVSTGSKIETFSYLEGDTIQEFIKTDITEQMSNADEINVYNDHERRN